MKRKFNEVDAVLCIVLAARIHRNGRAVAKTAKRLIPLIPKPARAGIGRFIDAMAPLETAEMLLECWHEVHELPIAD